MTNRPITGAVALLTLALGACTQEPDPMADPTLWDDAIDEEAMYLGLPPSKPEHDATVALHYDGGFYISSAFCSGTYSFDRWVVSAGHCAEGIGNGQMIINFGDNSNQLGTNSYDSTRVIPHPQYDGWSLANDISLIQMASSTNYADPVMPLPASIGLTQSDLGTRVDIAGFGEQENGNYGQLEYLTLPINDVNPKEFGYDQGNGGGNGTGGPCFGDSGGPAYITRSGAVYNVGAVSYGDQNCNNWGYSTRVDAFETWIENTTGEQIVVQSGTQNETFTGSLSGSGDRRLHQYSSSAGGTHTATLTAQALNYDLYLLKNTGVGPYNGWEVRASSENPNTSNESLSKVESAGGSFGVGVWSKSGSGSYTIQSTHPA